MVLVRTARRILAEVRALDDELDRHIVYNRAGEPRSLSGPCRSQRQDPPGVLARLKAENPEIRVDLQQGRTEELLPLLAAGEVDLVVGRLYAPAHPDHFTRAALERADLDPRAHRASRPFRASRGRYPAPLRDPPPDGQSASGQEIEQVMARLGLSPSTSLRSSSSGFIREMLHASDLIAVMPRLIWLEISCAVPCRSFPCRSRRRTGPPA